MSRTLWRSAVVAALVIFSGCHDDPAGPQFTQLSAAESRWRSVQPASNSYTMRQQVSCFCRFGGAAYQVTIVAGAIVDVRDPATGEVLPADLRPSFKTIDQLFDAVRVALKNPETLRAVTYDAAQGYPTLVSLDPVKNAVDDEVVFTTSGFTVTP